MKLSVKKMLWKLTYCIHSSNGQSSCQASTESQGKLVGRDEVYPANIQLTAPRSPTMNAILCSRDLFHKCRFLSLDPDKLIKGGRFSYDSRDSLISDLPGQGGRWHNCFCCASPSQVFPPFSGAGCVQFRKRS